MTIVLEESDDKTKYELFIRLNTGGSVATPQEVRNCLMIMAFPSLYPWIRELANVAVFRDAISISEQAGKEAYAMELATRFVMFRKMPEDELGEVGDIGDYLNKHLDKIHFLSDSAKKEEEVIFRETFRYINAELGEDAFRRFDKTKKKFQGGFSISAFETVALGIGFNVKADGRPAIQNPRKKVESIWSNAAFTDNSGSGARASFRS